MKDMREEEEEEKSAIGWAVLHKNGCRISSGTENAESPTKEEGIPKQRLNQKMTAVRPQRK